MIVRGARWACLLLTLLTMLHWAASMPFNVTITPGAGHELNLHSGRLNYRSDPVIAYEDWSVEANAQGSIDWALDWHVYPGTALSQGSWFARVPLWIPLAAFGLPAGALWFSAFRRRRSGGCARCGYPLTGLVAGDGGTVRCPECGTSQRPPRGR